MQDLSGDGDEILELKGEAGPAVMVAISSPGPVEAVLQLRHLVGCQWCSRVSAKQKMQRGGLLECHGVLDGSVAGLECYHDRITIRQLSGWRW